MRFVFHVDDETAHLTIDGRLISIPPNELFEVPELRGNHFNNNGPCEYIIPDHKMVEHICAQGWYHGIVEVPVVKSKTGMNADVKAAEKLATDALFLAQNRMLEAYVSEQQERMTLHNKPAVAPNGRLLKIIELRKIDLKKEFNIDPPGYRLDQSKSRDAEMDDMKKQLADMQKLLEKALKK